MGDPEYLICLECETPTYQFEYDGKAQIVTVLCPACGSDDPTEFVTEAELEEMSG